MHPRNFGSEKIVGTYVHPFRWAGVKFSILSTYPRVSEVKRIATQTFRDKENNNNKGDSFFGLNINV